MAFFENLIWDSNFFNLRIGRLIIEENCAFNSKEFSDYALNNYDLVYVVSMSKPLPQKKVIETNLNFMDTIILMSKNLQEVNLIKTKYNLRTDLNKDEIENCYGIAEQISRVSRFNKEPLIGPTKTKLLYKKWVDNALNKTHSDGIFIFKTGHVISGMNIIKTDNIGKIGACSIIGVEKSIKGNGIGRNLWEQAFSYWTSLGDIRKCIVPFSLHNIKSFNFHLRLGFNMIEEIRYIYHYRNPNL